MVNSGLFLEIHNMKTNQLPQDWQPPQWHSDFGDPVVQLEHLRCFAIGLSLAIPNTKTVLETPEPGLMDVRVELPNGETAEVHSVPGVRESRNRRLAVFLWPETDDEIEEYLDSVGAAVELFEGRKGSGKASIKAG